MAKTKEEAKPSASTQEALSAIGQLVNLFKGLKQAEGVMQALEAAEQRTRELTAASEVAAAEQAKAAEQVEKSNDEAAHVLAAADELAAQKVKDADARVEAMIEIASRDVAEVNKRAAALNKKLSANEAAANDAEIRRQQAEEELRNLNAKIDAAKAKIAELLG